LKLLEIITKLTLIRDIRLHSMHKRVHTQTHERHGSILFRLASETVLLKITVKHLSDL